MSQAEAPKVFLSHAGEDKDRFVLGFATALRAKGLDVWLDRWEILPGDSLVERIFTEGIDEADAFIIVLSAHSVTKRWVGEELSAAVVKRIEERTKLIPVVLDGLQRDQVPAAIRHLLWESIGDLDNYVEALDRITRAVFGRHDKPVLGQVPGYARTDLAQVPGLSSLDSLILKAAGDEAVRDFGDLFRTDEFFTSLTSLGIEEAAFIESMDVLDTDGYVQVKRVMGSGLPAMPGFKLTIFGLDQYAQTYVGNYDDIVRDVGLQLAALGDSQGTDQDVASATGHPRMLVLHVLRMLADRGLLRLSEPHGPWAHFYNVSPKIRRLLSDD